MSAPRFIVVPTAAGEQYINADMIVRVFPGSIPFHPPGGPPSEWPATQIWLRGDHRLVAHVTADDLMRMLGANVASLVEEAPGVTP